MIKIGVISDTHGLLRPEAASALAGVEHILHAGDVGKPAILAELQAIAPVTAVRGNVDAGDWAEKLPLTAATTVAGRRVYMLHSLGDLEVDPAQQNIAVVVSGHTHKPLIEWRDGVLYVNPGSAGPRRFSLPISIGFLRFASNAPIEAWLETLDV
jgi:uncharacterized protein